MYRISDDHKMNMNKALMSNQQCYSSSINSKRLTKGNTEWNLGKYFVHDRLCGPEIIAYM